MSAVAPRQHHNVTLGVLALSALAYALLQTMVAPALPEIQHELGASPSTVTWVLTVYLLSASVTTPILGRLGDIFGKERTLVAVLALFALGSLIAALSNSLALLVAGRAVQGAGGAVFPLAFGIIRDEFPRERVATGIGLISATFGIGGGAGLVLSGLIVDNLSYRWIFWFGLIVVLIATVATHLFVPESPIKSPAKIDYGGAALLSLGLSALLLAVSEGERWGWTSAPTLGLFAAAVVLLIWWVIYEQRVPEPMVDIDLLRLRGVWTTNLTAFLIGFGMFGSFILIPQFVQAPESAGYGFGVGVTGAGLFLLPSAVVMLVAGPLAGMLGTRFGSKLPLQIGMASALVSFAFLSIAHSEQWQIVFAVFLLGFGIGMSFASMANLIVEAVPQRQTGEATGMNTIMRTVGGAFGAQIAAAIVTGHIAAGETYPAESGFTAAFVMGTIAIAVGLGAASLIPGRRRAASAEEVVPV
ncbi:MAG TPA: MFS transporter [Thermoleophilaceae bacterium]|jgi:EmrB/QacA subfamily drug resistance transporter